MAILIESLESRLMWSASLSGSFAGHLPVSLSPFKPNRVALRVVNTGDELAGGRVSVNLYASDSAAPGGSQTLLSSSQRTIRVQPGRAMNLPLRFNSPSGLPDGNYYLLAQLGGDAVRASGAAIASAQPVRFSQPFIDLVGQFSTFPVGPVDVNNGTGGVLGARVFNRGNAPAAGPLAVSFYASTDATPGPSDALIAVAARSVRIAPGGSQVFSAPITFPSGFAAGNYYVFAQVDSAQAFAESNEDNNTVLAPRQLIAANVPPPTVVDQRHEDHHDHHHGDVVVVSSGGLFVGVFAGDVIDSGDLGGDPFMPDTSPPADNGMDQPPADSTPPDSQPTDTSGGGWDMGSSAGSDF